MITTTILNVKNPVMLNLFQDLEFNYPRCLDMVLIDYVDNNASST